MDLGHGGICGTSTWSGLCLHLSYRLVRPYKAKRTVNLSPAVPVRANMRMFVITMLLIKAPGANAARRSIRARSVTTPPKELSRSELEHFDSIFSPVDSLAQLVSDVNACALPGCNIKFEAFCHVCSAAIRAGFVHCRRRYW